MNKTKAGYDDGFVEPFNAYYVPERVGRWVIEINNGISCQAQFSDAIRVLEMADEDNPVEINLQCYGGSLDAADSFIHAMRKCRAPIHVCATGGNHSAATLILLEATSFELSEGFNSLIHNGSLGTVGNLNEYVSKAKFDSGFLPKIFRSYYKGFLTEEEIDGVIRGDNIWLDDKAWAERYEQRNEYFKNKMLEAQKPPKKPRKPKLKAVVNE